VGSLKSALAAVPPSPTFSTLQSFNMALLKANSAEGQALRRKALRGAIVVFFTAGYSGKRFIFDKAHQLGVRIVVVDGPDSWAKALVRAALAQPPRARTGLQRRMPGLWGAAARPGRAFRAVRGQAGRGEAPGARSGAAADAGAPGWLTRALSVCCCR
jgi:hypothetical protein